MSTVPEQLSVFALPPRVHGSQAVPLSRLEGSSADKRSGLHHGVHGGDAAFPVVLLLARPCLL